ncbi:MAG: HupE/UreJ family protein [Paracoccaceae bacterium]
MPDRHIHLNHRSVKRPSWFAALVIAAALSLATSATAHFLLNLNVRILHIEHLAEGLRVYIRMPMQYLVAREIGPEAADGLPEPAPFTLNDRIDGRVVHFVNPAQIAADPLGLGRLAEEGFTIDAAGSRIRGEVQAIRLHRVGTEPGFATLVEAFGTLNSEPAIPEIPPPLFVGDAVIDVIILYTLGSPVSSYSISSTLDPGLPGQTNTANLILDYGPGNPQVFRSRGLLADPVAISRGTFAAVGTFIYEGIRHILEGLDHVLFVVCLVIGASTFQSLLWRVTGFTIGHSFTLALGFFGYVPKGPWFVPFVETGVAMSIIYAAALAVKRRSDTSRPETGLFLSRS